MNELAYHCSLYIKAEPNETMQETANRLERILAAEGINYQYYDMELMDNEGKVLETSL